MVAALDNDELKNLRVKLKCGEYDGADLMRAWLAIDELIESREWRDKTVEISTTEKQAIYEELRGKFIVYQHRLDRPFPAENETHEAIILKYQTNHGFRSKVDHLVMGVMQIIDKHIG
jgi:hypothetical protein